MKIRINSHPRGFAISVDEPQFLNVLMRQFEHAEGAEDILFLKGRMIVPMRLVAKAFELFTDKDVFWDDKIYGEARQKLQHRQMQLDARLEIAQALEDPQSSLCDFEHLSKLDPHQVTAVAAITVPSLRGLALFDEQGTGKTIIALASFGRLKDIGKIQRLLVIAPKSVLGVWKSDCKTLFGDKYIIETASGVSSNRRRSIQSQHDILLVSYEIAVREAGLIKMVTGAEPTAYMLVIDESYFVKNSQAIRSKAIAAIRPLCERAIALCGSPAPNSPLDVINQVDLIDGGVAFAGRTIPKDRELAVPEIKKGLEQTIYLRRLKEEVLPQIPAKQFERVLVDLRPVQESMYTRARDELVLLVKNTDEREFLRNLGSFFAMRSALLQICSNPITVDPSYAEVPAKLLALDRLLNELIGTKNKKVIVWSFFRGSLQSIAQRYQEYGSVRIDGSVISVEDRIEAIDRFQNDDNVRLFIGNAAAAGAGITLTASHHAIYESFSNQAAHYMQSVDRIHRRGQSSNVTSHILLSKHTIEMSEFDRILRKEKSARNLLGDSYKEPITRTRFLVDLGVAE